MIRVTTKIWVINFNRPIKILPHKITTFKKASKTVMKNKSIFIFKPSKRGADESAPLFFNKFCLSLNQWGIAGVFVFDFVPPNLDQLITNRASDIIPARAAMVNTEHKTIEFF